MANNIKNLDFKTAGFWPAPMKMLAYAFAFFAVLIGSWFAWFSAETNRLGALTRTEEDLKKKFQDVAAQASNLDALKNQLVQIDDLLKTMVLQLPSQNEIPDLVVSVSQAAVGSGLEVDLFQPQAEEPKDFYAEKKIDVKFRGSYHQLGTFFSEVAHQDRLVAVVIDDMTLGLAPVVEKPVEDGAIDVSRAAEPAGVQLNFTGSVRTYRYLDENEQAANAPAPRAGRPARGKKPAATPAD